ncbi:hypothetical protein N5D09_19405 [Stutzerimonas stutzeri]|uniref:Uncharacterized protein n=1 Tax=Stutzerimonas stutzeri TaxID=316 RepID=A0ABD4Y517_STUST|nr:hypothetical protein [Stutzerimonas stutzeri]MDH0690263.1 hypothetical protein [Stutzerimonas stutzeri]
MPSKDTLLLTSKLIDFDDARIETPSPDYHPYLVVTGVKAYANMRVELNPRLYITRPEYWAIEVVGTLTHFGLPALTPFEVVIPINFQIGTKGIRVVGASKMVQIDCQSNPNATNPDDGGKEILIDRERKGI